MLGGSSRARKKTFRKVDDDDNAPVGAGDNQTELAAFSKSDDSASAASGGAGARPPALRKKRSSAAGAGSGGGSVRSVTTSVPGRQSTAGDLQADNNAAGSGAGVSGAATPPMYPPLDAGAGNAGSGGAPATGAYGGAAVGTDEKGMPIGSGAVGGAAVAGSGAASDPASARVAGGAAAGGIGVELDGIKPALYREVGGVPIRYFSPDPIENFKVKITLTRQIGEAPNPNQLPLTERAARFFEKVKAIANDEMGNRSVQHDEKDTRAMDHKADLIMSDTIEWQQKLFSPREMLRLTDPDFDPRAHTQTASGGSPLLDQENAQAVSGLLKLLYRDRFVDGNAALMAGDEKLPAPASPSAAGAGEDRRDAQLKLNMLAREFTVSRPFRLFTKVHIDGFVDPMDYKRHVTTSDDAGLNKLSKQVVELPIAQSTSAHTTLLSERFQTFYICAAVDLPDNTNELKSASRQLRVGYERVLCQVRAYSNGMFVMTPGFSEKSKDPGVSGGAQSLGEDGWYTFESPKGDRYRYRLEAPAGCLEDETNTEEGRLAEQQRHNRRELARALDRERFQRLKLQSVDFDPSPVPSVFQFNGFNEIVKATGFNADNIYVEYELYIPPGFMWSPRDPFRRTSSATHVAQSVKYPKTHPTALTDFSQSAGAAPISSSSSAAFSSGVSSTSMHASGRSSGASSHPTASTPTVSYTTNNSPSTPLAALQTASIGVAHFAHPIEFEVLGSLEQHALLAQWPTVYFQVTSVDRWDTHRVIGYTYCPLPRTPGTFTFELPCWRPIGSVRSQLQDFYVGGAPTLRDLSASGVPIGQSDVFLNKYGWRTETTGALHFRVNSIFTTHRPDKPVSGDDAEDEWRRAHHLTRSAAASGLSDATKKRMAAAVKRSQQQQQPKAKSAAATPDE